MDNRITPPVYSQIALGIALRIAQGELQEKTKVYGRSVLASHYGVSPETIRRAMALLEDANVVEIRSKSGATILSAESAAKYVERFGAHNDIRDYQRRLRSLIREQLLLSQKIA